MGSTTNQPLARSQSRRSFVAAPFPLSRCIDDSCSNWIQNDVTGNFQQIPFAVDQMRFETPLEKVSDTRMDDVEMLCVLATKPLHAARQRHFGRRKKQMIVIRHKHICVKLPSAAVDHTFKNLEEILSIAVVEEDQSLLDTTSGDVPQCTWKFESQRPGHTSDEVS